jgi:hypothetical protein
MNVEFWQRNSMENVYVSNAGMGSLKFWDRDMDRGGF